MKKFAVVLFSLALLTSIYVDLTSGTLPAATVPVTTEVKKEDSASLPYFKATVKPGQTLLSIIEQHEQYPQGVPVSKVIKDFVSLNPGASPETLQIGKTYMFPNYVTNE